MGTGDRSDPTTDFFDTHRMQCASYAEKLRSLRTKGDAQDSGALIADMDQAVADCDVAIAKGRRRVDMPPVVTKMPAIVTKYVATSQKTKDDLREALKTAAPTDPKPRTAGTK